MAEKTPQFIAYYDPGTLVLVDGSKIDIHEYVCNLLSALHDGHDIVVTRIGGIKIYQLIGKEFVDIEKGKSDEHVQS